MSSRQGGSRTLNDYVRVRARARWRKAEVLAATWRLAREGRLWAGLSCVIPYSPVAIADVSYAGALNWATGETVAIKEITLSNIPKAELGEIMVRRTHPIMRSMVLTHV